MQGSNPGFWDDYFDALDAKQLPPRQRALFRPRPSIFTAPARERVTTPPELSRRINARVKAGELNPTPPAGCQCLVLVTRSRDARRGRVIWVDGKAVPVARVLYAQTFDIPAADMPKALYQQCRTPFCVQPYHYKHTVPKGRRGGGRKRAAARNTTF